MRKDGQFNFESLSRGAAKITISDCQNLFDYSKLLFELQKYECKFLLHDGKQLLIIDLVWFGFVSGAPLLVHLERDTWHAGQHALSARLAGLLGLARL